MGTETHRLQEEIKALIARMGWSQRTLAGELWSLEYDTDFPQKEDVDRFAERLKKHLTRPTAAPEKLQHYLELIQQHDQFRQLDLIVPRLVPSAGFSPEFLEGMRKISVGLDDEG
ncbi:hypothetical protein ALP39_200441 [Pseudomonas marginalis pv. marginalis]|uniref:Elongation factor Ts n=2 Tax=Pseudomonas fluorescens group TaxID=136843 RepID=A0A127I771_PSEAZ|nr:MULTISPECIES: hypothetical protein [Pseudomonas fluorescens group]RMT95155.1 hypothetical protein ALP39_200441 [Pseudomonas marginalis pv. marginalis]AMN82547.1 hypothetical protein AYR47_31470 [Pseudomonas azotoformans]MBD8239524.1 hypothetical protein [Pseudomonas fluorescens]MDY0898430.1 hypothetical protein [Pseudomonas fluorescens]TFW43126.1 hypothetical protein E4T65_12235 [Pseudomonas fluorescens]